MQILLQKSLEMNEGEKEARNFCGLALAVMEYGGSCYILI